jgi:hypothetical protein
MNEDDDAPRPPQPPPVDKKLQFYRLQWVGIPLLMLIPILALLNVFGVSWETAVTTSNTLTVQIKYPSRDRYQMSNALEIHIENNSQEAIPTIIVSLDAEYVTSFSTVTFYPELDEIINGQYQVKLENVQAGETRLVVVEIQGKAYGRHKGTITISTPEEEVAVPIHTTIIP